MTRARLNAAGYKCKVCGDVLATPGALGGHMSGHVNGSEVPRLAPALPVVALYCECGSALTLRGETSSSVANAIETVWRVEHLDYQRHRLVSASECNLQREYRKRQAAQS